MADPRGMAALVETLTRMTPAGANPEDDADMLNDLIRWACEIVGTEPFPAGYYDDDDGVDPTTGQSA